MKKLLSGIVIALTLVLSLSLFACGGDDGGGDDGNACVHEWYIENHEGGEYCTDEKIVYERCNICQETKETVIPAGEHEMGEGSQGTLPSCTSKGEMIYRCNKCPYETVEEVAEVPHTSDGKWYSDGTEHWLKCSVCYNEFDKAACTIASGDCDGCDYELIRYTLEGDTYTVSGIRNTQIEIEKIVIPDEYNGKPVTKIGSSAFSYCVSLTEVVFGKNVTEIGYCAFERTSLKKISITEQFTYIEEHAFEDCAAEEIYFNPAPDAEIKNASFYNVGKGKNLKFIIGKDVESFKNDLGVVISTIEFEENSSLKALEESAFSWSSIKSIELPQGLEVIEHGAFSYCDSLTTIVVPDSVTTVGASAFLGCKSLETVTLGTGVRSIGNSAFKDCVALKKVTVNGSLADMEDFVEDYSNNIHPALFANAGSKSGGFDLIFGSNVARIVNYFAAGADGLKSVKFAKDAPVSKIGRSAFSGSDALVSVELPDAITEIDNFAFDSCVSLKSVTHGTEITRIGERAFANCYRLVSFDLGDNLTELGSEAFQSCRSLYEITIPSSLKSVGVHFSYSGLVRAVIEEGVEEVSERAFIECNKLSEIANASSVELGTLYIRDHGTTVYFYGRIYDPAESSSFVHNVNGYIFYAENGSVTLASYVGDETEIRLPAMDKISSFTTADGYFVGTYAFYYSKVVSAYLPECVTGIGANAFEQSFDLEKIEGCEGVRYIHKYAFNECRALKNISPLPKLQTLREYAFANCASLIYVELGDNLQAIENDTFNGCLALINVKLPKYLETIGEHAFRNCRKLAKLELPSSFKSLSERALFLTYSLAEITVSEYNDYFSSIDGHLYNKDGTKLIKFAPGSKTSVFVIPENVTELAPYAFSFASNLCEIKFNNKITSIPNNTFFYTRKLHTIDLPDTVTTIDPDAFDRCYSVVKVILGSGIDENSMANLSFYECRKLREIYNLTRFEYTRTNTAIYTDKDAASSMVIVDDYLFFKGDGVNYLVTYLGQSLDLVLPESFDGGDYEIAPSAFEDTLIRSIKIPNAVTEIGYDCLKDCLYLEKIEYNGKADNAYPFLENSGSETVDGIELIYGGEGTSLAPLFTYNNGAYYVTKLVIKDGTSGPRYNESCFDSLSNLKVLIFDTTLTSHDKGSLFNGMTDSPITVIIGENCKSLSQSLFTNVSANSFIIVPGNSLTTAHWMSLGSYEKFYYGGTDAEWDELVANSNNSYANPFNYVEPYLYSETKPAEDGNFWHYDADGVAVEW